MKKKAATQTPSIAQTPRLRADMTPQEAAQTVVSETVRHLQANVPGVLESDDMEFVHQARVALRRLRSTNKAFTGIITDEEWQSVDEEIEWLAKLLGDARDLDVFLMETLPPIEQALMLDADFGPLKQAMLKRRVLCRKKIRAALTSVRYGALLLRLLAWTNEETQQEKFHRFKLRNFARQSMNKRWRQVNRPAQKWRSLNREQRHDLRKKAKTLRYAVEFFSALYPPKKVERYVNKLQSLQQILGVLNDGVAAQWLMAEFIKKDASLEPLGKLVFGWLACEATRSETYLQHAITQWQKAKAFW